MYTVYREILLPPFYFHPLHTCIQWAILRLGELQCLKVSLSLNTTLGEFKTGRNPLQVKNGKK